MDITVLVLTYNVDYAKLFLTLRSVLAQDYASFDVVVADDGSRENPADQIREFFRENHFERYRLVMNRENRGTVRNILSGLRFVKGKYVKLISAGDCLYDRHTLEKVFRFMEDHNSHCCFGLLRGYKKTGEGRIQAEPFCHPFDIEAYRTPAAHRRIMRNLVLYSDNACGAAICYRTDFCRQYLWRIRKYVKYEEDLCQVLAAVEGKPLILYDDYIVWYEIGGGISTSKNSRMASLLSQDVDRFYVHLYREYPHIPEVRKRHGLRTFYAINNLYLRSALRVLVNPDAIRYILLSMTERKHKAHLALNAHPGFLDRNADLC